MINRSKNRGAWLSAVSVVAISVTMAGMARAQGLNVANVEADANWIQTAAIQSGPMSGAIANYPGGNYIAPYQANYACIGLAVAYWDSQGLKPSYLTTAWNYLNWYGSTEVTGNQYDSEFQSGAGYFMPDFSEASNGTWSAVEYDSTDSYAATFLTALATTYRINPTGYTLTLQNLKPAILDACSDIYVTQDTTDFDDGMTWCKPQYEAKYLEDNIETYQGLWAAQYLLSTAALNDSADATIAQNRANDMGYGIGDVLWDSGGPYYYVARSSNGVCNPPNTAAFGDALAEGFAGMYGFAGSNLPACLNYIHQYFPNWANPGDYGTTSGGVYQANYAPEIGWAYYNNNQASLAQSSATQIRNYAYNTAKLAWPWTPQDAGMLIVLECNGEAEPRF